jgi:hypothetical protein
MKIEIPDRRRRHHGVVDFPAQKSRPLPQWLRKIVE